MKGPRKLLLNTMNFHLKFWAKFDLLSSIFHGINESWQKSACVWQIFQIIFAIISINILYFSQQNKENITKLNKISWNITSFHEITCCNISILWTFVEFYKLSLSSNLVWNFFCLLSANFAFHYFQSFLWMAMAKVKILNIAVTYF